MAKWGADFSSAPHWLSGSSRSAVYQQNVPRFIVILFLDKMVNTIYPANTSQAAGGGEKCMDCDFSGYTADR